MKQFERSLMFGLSLRNNTRETDKAAVMALDHCEGIFDNVVICVPSWQETPLAIGHPLVRCAITMLSEMGIKIVWGRKAFISWPNLCAAGCLGLEFHDAFKWEFWYKLLAQLHAEQQDLHEHCSASVVGTFANTEPDGKGPMEDLQAAWETRWWGPLTRAADIGRVEAGGGLTRVSPVTGPYFASALKVIGNERDERQVYWIKPPFTAVPWYCQCEWWNTLVSPNGKMARGVHQDSPKDCCTPVEAMQFDNAVFEELREQIPTLRGQTIFAHPQDTPDVLRLVQEAGR
jgi:hypothetical protein